MSKFDLVSEVKWEGAEPLHPGDTIRCKSEEDMLDYMTGLAKAGVETDWEPEETAKGLWVLHVKEVK